MLESHPIGNGSLSGAYATLVSQEFRKQAQEVAHKMVYIDLLVDADFIEEYSAALYIPGKPSFPQLSPNKSLILKKFLTWKLLFH